VGIKNRGLLIVVSLLIVLVFLVISKPLFSPSDNSNNELIGCGIGQGPGGQGQGPPIPPPPGLPIEPPPHYGNCVADALAKLNKDTFGDNVDEGQLRYDITMCLQKKGYQVPVGNPPGVPLNGMNDALECKKKAMEQFEITESFGTGSGGGMSPPISSGDSVFENNCPKIGSTILFTFITGNPRGGHATVCIVKKCNPGFGAATLACSESSFSPGAGTDYDLDVKVDGTITADPPLAVGNPPVPVTGLFNSGWTQIK